MGVRAVAGVVALGVLATVGCTLTPLDTNAIIVTVKSNACTLSPSTAMSGTVYVTVVNASDEVAAVNVLATVEVRATGALRAVGEPLAGIGNLAPGLSRDARFVLAPGEYFAECIVGPGPGGVASRFSISDSGENVAAPPSTTGAAESYASWVSDTTAELREATGRLAVAFVPGDPEAQQLYREARALWASLRPAVQRFPELLPALDARESDLIVGERLSGWHAVEKDLWPPSNYQPLDANGRADLSAQVHADLTELLDRVEGAVALDAVAIAAGAQDLMDAASRSWSDGDERWSHADSWLVSGDLDGAAAAIDALRPWLAKDDPELLALIDERSAGLRAALSSEQGPREIATGIDALAAALSMIDLGDARIEQ